MKKLFVLLSLLIIFIGILQIIYSERFTFTQNYDDNYWKDRFEHSQWVLPLSKRIIGDDGLYAYIGYKLIRGYELDGFDAEVPPLGKYFIGLSILIFDNPAYYALIFGLGSIYLFYLIARRVLNSTIGAYFALCLLFLDPLFFSQFWKSALDICQLFFLLLNILFFINFVNSKASNRKRYVLWALVCGFSLGLFSQVKFPVLLPIIIAIETLYFFTKNMKKIYVFYLFGITLAVLIVNVKLFIDGNSLIDFVNLQKYVLSFYLKSQLVTHNEAIWRTLFFGQFPEIPNRNLIQVSEWWIMWPFAAILALPASFVSIFRKGTFFLWRGFGLILLSGLTVYTFIPSYPRYLIILLPFIYLFFTKVFFYGVGLKLRYILIIVILGYGLIHSNMFLRDDSNNILNNFYYNFSHQYFKDVYQENLGKKNKDSISREKFWLTAQNAFRDAEIKSVRINEITKNIGKNEGIIKLRFTYFTQDLGSFSEVKDVKLISEYGKWKIDWTWDLIFNGFLPEYVIDSKKIIGRRGAIIGSDGKVMVRDSAGYLISVNPEKIDLKREQEMLKFISALGNVEAPYLQNAYLENSLPGKYIPLITLFDSFEEGNKKRLLSFPGVKLISYNARIFNGIDDSSIKNTLYEECCTRIYSSYSYHGVKGLEKEYDSSLSGHDGGTIKIKNKKGEMVRTILEKKAKNGQDVTLPL